jgi:hypothetical protein
LENLTFKEKDHDFERAGKKLILSLDENIMDIVHLIFKSEGLEHEAENLKLINVEDLGNNKLLHFKSSIDL